MVVERIRKICSYYGHNTIIAHLKRKNKQNNIEGKKSSTESKFQKKFVKNNNKSKSSNKTTFKKRRHQHVTNVEK